MSESGYETYLIMESDKREWGDKEQNRERGEEAEIHVV